MIANKNFIILKIITGPFKHKEIFINSKIKSIILIWSWRDMKLGKK